MENYQGDLTDILRATTSKPPTPQAGTSTLELSPSFNNLVKFQSSQTLTHDDFGDPFSNMQDPLLLLNNNTSSSFFFNSTTAVDNEEEDDQMRMLLTRPSSSSSCSSSSCDMFSRVLQISPTAVNKTLVMTPPRGESPVQDTTSLINVNNNNNNNITGGGLQICSPRNPAIKRRYRKSQAKKVVCIPAPAPVNSRPSGEIVPSDLWAWRKYGQKPIKGSPYPRGYYRCSSSKGCSARKQVERSRTEPNMLVITYSSEHNHPWPTQRNALAGSTRAQPSKPNAQKPNDVNEDFNDTIFDVSVSTSTSAYVKDEMRDSHMDEGFSPSYKPTMPLSNLNSCDEFFADPEEIETDPIRILLDQDHEENYLIKGLDPFTVFDWSGHTNRSL